MTVAATREIDWSPAVVNDAALTVDLTGEPSQRWSEHMKGVVDRLGPRGWGPIKVGKRRIKVGSVGDGAADELRHLLEGAAQQTNADLAPPPAEEGDPETAAEDDADRVLTEAYRAFAP